jgi:uncharacterized protein YjbI with pentapeptide repeats
MSVIKGDNIIFTKNVFQWKQKYYAVLGAAIGFKLKGSKQLVSELEMQNAWPSLNLDSAIDEGYPKSRAEVLVMGNVTLPKDKAPHFIHLKMQGIDKKLAVHGHKVWEKVGFSTLDTKPVVRAEDSVPLSWEHAFGGKGFLANPAGKGFAESRFDFSDKDAPVAYPHFMAPNMGSFNPTSQAVEPDCLAPLSLLHPLRQRYFNATKAYWLEQGGLPTLPDTLDLDYFQQVPRNQQREGFFQAGEEFSLSGVGAEIKGKLPDVNVRLFTASRKLAINEYALQRDTLMLIPEHNLGIILFRATVPVQDIHANEHVHYMLALEAPDSAQPAAFYHQQLFEYLGPGAALKHAYKEGLGIDKSTPPELQKLRDMQKQVQPKSPPFWNKPVAKVSANADKFKGEKIGEQFFSNLEFANVDLGQKIFVQTKFSHCLFKNVSFKESQFTGVQFMDCEFEGCNLNQSQWADTQVMNVSIRKSDWKGARLSNVMLYRIRANQLAFQGTLFKKVQATQGIWRHVDLRYSTLWDARFHNVEILESNLSQMEAYNSTLTGQDMLFDKVKMEQGRWEGMNFLESTFYRCTIKNNRLPGSEWASTRLIRTELQDNIVTDNTFVDSTWLGVKSAGNDFSNGFFRGAHFKYSQTADNNWQKVDLRHVITKPQRSL